MATKPKQPSDIRVTARQNRGRLLWQARLDDGRRICAEWHNRFGACLVLDDARFRAVCKWLVEAAVPVADLVAAIEAYHRHVRTDPWYQKDGRADQKSPAGTKAHKDLAGFLEDGQFERWLEAGRSNQVAPETPPVGKAEGSRIARLSEQFERIPRAERVRLFNRGEIELKAAGCKTDYQSIRRQALEVLDRELQEGPR